MPSRFIRLRRAIKNRVPFSLPMAISLIGLVGGAYLLLISFSPAVVQIPPYKSNKTTERLQAAVGTYGDRLFIPKINVDVAIVQGDSNAVLEQGAWHRQPQNGDPLKGGNFVLSAHRFNLGLTPQGTRAKSPFYNLHKLQIGDQLFVDYQGKRFGYAVVKKYAVKPSQTEIEGPSDTAKMTLYSCKLSGAADGRDVIEAEPLIEQR
jgi:LPXTG-site transpeptidase (sortase) family protein